MLNFEEDYFFENNNSKLNNDTDSSTDSNNSHQRSIAENISDYVLCFFLFISFLINFIIILIHKRQPFLRQGFFIIVFVQIILEASINLSSLIMKIIYMSDTTRDVWFALFPILFNFCYMTNVLYNIRIIIFLKNYDKDRDESINYDARDANSNNSFSHQGSISFNQQSFKYIHICSFTISVFYILFYIIHIFNIENIAIEDEKWRWVFYYLVDENGGYYKLIFFIPNFIYFIVSVYYLFLSMNKGKVTNHILLKNFSIYCVFSSIVSLLFPITLIVNLITITVEQEQYVFHYIILCGFLVYIIVTCCYRMNCYYVKYILDSEGKGFFKRCTFGFKILFCCKKIEVPNFIDLNSSFILHSLANFSDFLGEDKVDNDELIGESK
jgi:hypothetical protein